MENMTIIATGLGQAFTSLLYRAAYLIAFCKAAEEYRCTMKSGFFHQSSPSGKENQKKFPNSYACIKRQELWAAFLQTKSEGNPVARPPIAESD